MNIAEYVLNNLKDMIERDSGLKLQTQYKGNPKSPMIFFCNNPADKGQDHYLTAVIYEFDALCGDGELYLKVVEGSEVVANIAVGQLPAEYTVSEFIKHCNIGINAE